MQLFLILGISFAIGAVSFALQNDVPVTVMFSNWRFDGSLAVVLLVALDLGSLIAALVSTPSAIEGQWIRVRLRRQIASVEKDKEIPERRVRELELEIAQLCSEPAPLAEGPKPYVGLKSMLLPGEKDKQKKDGTSPARVMQGTGRS